MKPHEIIDRFVDLAREASKENVEAGARSGLVRLEQSLARDAGRRRRPVRALWVAFAVSAAIAGLVAVRLRDRPLTFEVTRGCTNEGGYIVSNAPEAAVRFSDHSEFALYRDARLRVSAVEERGAHLLLEGGGVHVRIRPRPQARWTINAGPYVVRVTGTEFELRWVVDAQVLDLRLQKGSVVVEGPVEGGDFRMVAGQHLIAHATTGSFTINEARSERAAQDATTPLIDSAGGAVAPGTELSVVPPANAPGIASNAAGTPATSNAPTMPAPASKAPAILAPPPTALSAGAVSSGRRAAPAHVSGADWTEQVARGDSRAILDEAEHTGIDRVLAQASPADLAALADAARYARSQDIARRALLGQRTRFPGSVHARDAAFFLGDLAESQHDARTALDWYETYLRESPDGAYASQALGRAMMLTEPLRGAEAARARAAEYLERYRSGPYAANARRLLPAP